MSKPGITDEDVVAALQSVAGPDGRSIVDAGAIGGVQIKDGLVYCALEVDPKAGAALETMRQTAERAIAAIPGVLSASVTLTAHREAPAQPAPRPTKPNPAPGVKHILAVASGKGGVGKSTTAANLALAFAAEGRAVGVMDADIFGPSMPRMLGVSGRPETVDGKILKPKIAHGLPMMSIGLLVDEATPMIWRGPMVMGAIQQLLRDVAWGDLDILVVDMPPGTGDAQLTLCQQTPLAGAVIVSTPQDIALLDARKGLNMFRKVDVPVLGIVENMSYFACPHCGERTDVFSHGGAREEAARLGTPFLGEIPLDIAIRETGDGGRPIVIAEPDGPHAAAYRGIARAVLQELDAGGAAKPAPTISFS